MSGLTMATIAFGKGAKLSVKAMQEYLVKTWPTLPRPTKAEKTDEGTVSFDMGGAFVAFSLMPIPIPDIKSLCEGSFLWDKDDTHKLDEHRTHSIVTVSQIDDAIERYKILTAVCAAIVATSEASLAVFWYDAYMLIDANAFLDTAQTMDEQIPLDIWVNILLQKISQDKYACSTRGLKGLGLMEIETLNATEDFEVLYDRILSLALYLIDNGPVIKDGDTIGEDSAQKIQVHYAKSEFGHEDKVMQLDFDSAKKKSRWFSN